MSLLLMVQFLAVLQEPMGRLFTTEEERRVLNELRDAPEQGGEVQEESPVEESDTTLVRQPFLQLDGIVHRSDGRHTAWFDGSALYPASGGIGISGWLIVRLEADRIELNSSGNGSLVLHVGAFSTLELGADLP